MCIKTKLSIQIDHFRYLLDRILVKDEHILLSQKIKEKEKKKIIFKKSLCSVKNVSCVYLRKEKEERGRKEKKERGQ